LRRSIIFGLELQQLDEKKEHGPCTGLTAAMAAARSGSVMRPPRLVCEDRFAVEAICCQSKINAFTWYPVSSTLLSARFVGTGAPEVRTSCRSSDCKQITAVLQERQQTRGLSYRFLDFTGLGFVRLTATVFTRVIVVHFLRRLIMCTVNERTHFLSVVAVQAT